LPKIEGDDGVSMDKVVTGVSSTLSSNPSINIYSHKYLVLLNYDNMLFINMCVEYFKEIKPILKKN